MYPSIEHKLVERYFRVMRNWDNEAKKSLIIKLTRSLGFTEEKRSDLSSCFGAWEDDRTADEIIEDIKRDRTDNQEIEDF